MSTPPRSNREHTVLDLHRTHAIEDRRLVSNSEDTRVCPSCKKPAAGKKGGLVIACGLSFYHVDCYKCKKCETLISVNDRVFLDLDGLPLCETCFHKCKACQLPISEKIIYVSEESFYHPECFKCKRCSKLLDERKFAKTSRSFYCLECHEKRIIKLKKQQDRKTRQEKLVYGGILSPKT